MENKETKRYVLGGYGFGSQGLVVLDIEILNHTETGTSYSTEIKLELTPEEKLELLTHLVKLGTEKNDDQKRLH